MGPQQLTPKGEKASKIARKYVNLIKKACKKAKLNCSEAELFDNILDAMGR